MPISRAQAEGAGVARAEVGRVAAGHPLSPCRRSARSSSRPADARPYRSLLATDPIAQGRGSPQRGSNRSSNAATTTAYTETQ
jgi:hypothetical protein